MDLKLPISKRTLNLHQKLSKEEVKSKFEKWATNYDKDLEGLEYRGYNLASEKATDLFPTEVRSQTRILDVGAGTGLLGSKLKEAGFIQIDAIDPVENMLHVAKEKYIYENHFLDYFTEKPLDIKQGTYDLVTGSGLFNYSLVPYQSITEMVRLVKSGGYIVLSMREGVLDYDEYKDMVPYIEQLEKEGHIKVISRTTCPDYIKNITGLVFVFQKK